MTLQILKYESKYEDQWLECLRISFFDSLYHDSVLKIKPRYENHSIELVAFMNDELVGLLDIEIVPPDEHICYSQDISCGQISLVAILRDKRRMKIGTKLLETAINILNTETTIKGIEILFRDDNVTSSWLETLEFKKCAHYYEISLTNDFFVKYGVKLPFGLIASRFNAFADQEAYEIISKEHAPEQTYPISVFQRSL
ncbi:MAG: GNAT family N-acetyltransferase [Candidatus Hodarchaeales archaeon]